MSRLSKCAEAVSIAALLVCPVSLLVAQMQSQPEMTRVSATLNGVFSPRGFFNILVPLTRLQGADAAKLDLKLSRITIDFADGASVSQDEIRQVMVEAGYRPGNILIARLPEGRASETGPGWIRIKHPRARNPLVRWLEENF